VIAIYDQPYAATETWMVSGKAQALALLGEEQAALEELRLQVDKGMRLSWRWQTELNPNFKPLWEDPEFQAIVDFLRSDMARQLEEVKAMQDAGEIPSAPGD
jgi:hypothetical protein